MNLSESCYRFASYLFNYSTDEYLSRPRESENAPESELLEWHLDKAEWLFAHQAAAQARRSGTSPDVVLRKWDEFFNTMASAPIDPETGNKVISLSLETLDSGFPR